jgi:Tfp pilus assembly protein PilF
MLNFFCGKSGSNRTTRWVVVRRTSTLLSLLVVLLFFSIVSADDLPPSPLGSDPGHDYFTTLQADDTSRGYLNIVTMAHTDKIVEWIRQGRLDNAVLDVRYTLDRFPNHPKGLQMAGIVAQLTKKPSLAVYYFERALKLYPQYAITHTQYGAYLVGIGETDAGIARLKEAVEIDPKLPAAYVLLAKAYNKNGNLELARQAAEKAKELGYKGEVPLQ